MNLGTIIVPSAAPPGRILLRKTAGVEILTFTTGPVGRDQKPVSVTLANQDQFHGVINKEVLNEPYWDVTDFVELRPSIETASFRDATLTHGQLFMSASGELIMCGSNDGPGGMKVFFKVGDGLEPKSFDPAVSLGFKTWRLVVVDHKGDETAKLYSWPSPKTPTATASY